MAEATEVQFDARNEQIVLGLMLVDAEVRSKLSRTLRAEDFVGKRHQTLFSAMRTLIERGLRFTDPTLLQISSIDGGAVYLDRLRKMVETRREDLAANLGHHLRSLAFDTARFRMRVEEIPNLTELLDDEDLTPERLKRELRRMGRMSEVIQGQHHVERGTSLVEAYLTDQRTGVGNRPTGFRILDNGEFRGDQRKLQLGTAPGVLGMIASRPATGKSTFATNMARRLASRGIRVTLCAWEMGKLPTIHLFVAQWFAAQRAGGRTDLPDVILDDLVARRWKDHPAIDEAVGGLFDSGYLGLMRNPFYSKEAEVRGWQRGDVNIRNLDLLEAQVAGDETEVWIFDLWERMLRAKKPDDIAAALERVQWMAHHYSKCFLVIQQIGRDWEKWQRRRRPDGTPQDVQPPRMSDIKNAGAYEEVADWIGILHRPGLYKRVPDDLLEWHCAKQRLGKWPWAAGFPFDGQRATIEGGGERVHLDGEPGDMREPEADADGGDVF